MIWQDTTFITSEEQAGDGQLSVSVAESTPLIDRIWAEVNTSPEIKTLQFASPEHKRRFCEVWVYVDICRE